ncbi:MAG: hypothetical protein SFU25_06390 [Candidatus Caenarcaniphilales bacterium]|nr:hypothetical protein [Candidatus Caenarcaniphilales bacterium]
MNSEVLEIIAVVSLTILAISLLIVVVAVVPILSQASKLLSSVDETVKALNTRIMPNLADLSDILGKTKKMVDQGQNLTTKVGQTASAISEGIKKGINTYLNKGKSS